MKKELLVAAIENGTVIDHIPAEALFHVVSLLKLDEIGAFFTVGNNLTSKKLGKKGIIKVSEVFFNDVQLNRIALVAPKAKINIIKDYEVVEKKNLALPEQVEIIIKCGNPRCITNNEPMKTRFKVIDSENISVKCCYCAREFDKEEIQFI